MTCQVKKYSQISCIILYGGAYLHHKECVKNKIIQVRKSRGEKIQPNVIYCMWSILAPQGGCAVSQSVHWTGGDTDYSYHALYYKTFAQFFSCWISFDCNPTISYIMLFCLHFYVLSLFFATEVKCHFTLLNILVNKIIEYLYCFYK